MGIFNFTRDRQIISQKDYTISHSYQQGIKVPVAADPDQCLGLPVFVPISILDTVSDCSFNLCFLDD